MAFKKGEQRGGRVRSGVKDEELTLSGEEMYRHIASSLHSLFSKATGRMRSVSSTNKCFTSV